MATSPIKGASAPTPTPFSAGTPLRDHLDDVDRFITQANQLFRRANAERYQSVREAMRDEAIRSVMRAGQAIEGLQRAVFTFYTLPVINSTRRGSK